MSTVVLEIPKPKGVTMHLWQDKTDIIPLGPTTAAIRFTVRQPPRNIDQLLNEFETLTSTRCIPLEGLPPKTLCKCPRARHMDHLSLLSTILRPP